MYYTETVAAKDIQLLVDKINGMKATIVAVCPVFYAARICIIYEY